VVFLRAKVGRWHGDARLPDLLATRANCEKARSLSIHDRWKAKFEGFSFRG
jgi:hypothetical protein